MAPPRLGIDLMSNRVHAPFPFGAEFPDKLDFLSLQFDDSGYRVRVSEFSNPNGPVYEINFGKMPLAQRSMDEGKFLAMTAISNEKVGPVVLVTGSDFLNWFHEQSCGVFTEDEVKHVAILTQNEWVEVLCLSLPTIRKIAT
ncbi:hypothetical protein CQ054_10600 [Ochrobactrum sp. MYb29]|nr:hypothetical protein CQ054_10600 [Ochrobactrum sp. MYb29]